MKFFTADPHFGDMSIDKVCERGFKSPEDMNAYIVDMYNKSVKHTDTLYFVGDLGFADKELISAINGTKILIIGNHDTLPARDYLDMGFVGVHTDLSLRIGWDRTIYDVWLSHDPCMSIVAKYFKLGTLICGHVHTLFKKCNNVINVGVDIWHYSPVNEETIARLIEGVD